MSADSDKVKGHVKQAVGELTDDKDLENEGKVDELAGKAKDAVDTVKDKLTGKD
ncbi:MAG TPA: CsbD family protein [Desertimonas sp.]|nr:CsbD family protein [Desertimonas sp.]HET9665626.1 CsbD family protein [Desertimonas sp.]